ncbi:MAG: UDP-3-O-(3-hydroxymyristoyl)glucosamine N-acyltransferase [Proteobacteria bacterium]|nr:UDP-3-O-(3-hydroxymyristoyl)glucosamine N-acyltransferase [Pseudomonadota bacterium]
MVQPVAGDPRFFRRAGPFPLSRIVECIGVAADARSGGEQLFVGIAPLQTAGPSEISFLTNGKYRDILTGSRAGAVLLDPSLAHLVPSGSIPLVSKQPVIAWARVASLFHPPPPVQPGVHPTAVVDPSARIAPDTEIGPFVVIGARVEIGPRCRIGPLVSIGDGVVIGADARIGSHVSISHSLIGERVTIFPGARLGQDGFGFDPTPTAQGFTTVPQLGRVLIGDDVEIGSNSMIDRGSAQDTIIGAGSRLDNSVQIAHNVQLGRCCVIVAQAGISGSTTLGDYVTVAGQAGMAGHLHIGQGARIGAQAGVMADVEPHASVVGSPAEPVREFFRQVAFLRRMMRRNDAAKHDTDAG